MSSGATMDSFANFTEQQRGRRRFRPLFCSSPYDPQEETPSFDDDEPLPPPVDVDLQQQQDLLIEVNTYPELPALPKSSSHQNFNTLVHIKAPKSHESTTTTTTRAPLDLVAVLDVSGSMAGPKLALMKQAIGFIILNLGPSDRLSIVSFSEDSQLLSPLSLMNHSGKQHALNSLHNLDASGGTHIAAGLHTGAKVITDRRFKNPVASIIFLSDGCDTYTSGPYDILIPFSIRPENNGLALPIHTFGFGSDHDPALMNTIAEATRGTFSFVESLETIQDAFAQCIAGLLSVVVQELQVKVECDDTDLRISSIKAGSYKTYIPLDARIGFIEVGDLYAEEERNFLVEIDIPKSSDIMHVLKISYACKCSVSKKLITMENVGKVSIERPESEAMGDIRMVVPVEVDRERSRVQAAEAIARAKALAESGNLAGGKVTLKECRGRISETRLRMRGDKVCESLEEELLEIEKKMENKGVYKKSGRAMAMSGLNSHMQQRAASIGIGFAKRSFQTPQMARMVQQSRQSLINSSSSGDQLPVPVPSPAAEMP